MWCSVENVSRHNINFVYSLSNDSFMSLLPLRTQIRWRRVSRFVGPNSKNRPRWDSVIYAQKQYVDAWRSVLQYIGIIQRSMSYSILDQTGDKTCQRCKCYIHVLSDILISYRKGSGKWKGLFILWSTMNETLWLCFLRLFSLLYFCPSYLCTFLRTKECDSTHIF